MRAVKKKEMGIRIEEKNCGVLVLPEECLGLGDLADMMWRCWKMKLKIILVVFALAVRICNASANTANDNDGC